MNWTYAGNVLVTVGGVLSTVWVLGRILRPWMRDEAAKTTEALYKRLKDNDFHDLEKTIQAVRDDMKSMEVGLRDDMKTMRDDMKTMESGLRDDMKTMEAGLRDEMKTMREDMRTMGTSLNDRIGRSETRLMAALARLAEPSVQGPPALAPSKPQGDSQ